MSHWAQGWAQRQRIGDPVAKAVLQTMCYVMGDQVLRVYTSVPFLAEYTEYDERTVRKALARLAELGVLLDTGQRRNNVTVWRIPGFERWLEAQKESPHINERASDTAALGAVQTTDSNAESGAPNGVDTKPPQKGEGLPQAPPLLQPGPDTFAPSPPKSVTQSSPDLKNHISPESGVAPASPTGGRSGISDTTPAHVVLDVRKKWLSVAYQHVVMECRALGIAAYGVNRFDQLPKQVVADLPAQIEQLVEKAVELQLQPKPQRFTTIQKFLEGQLTTALAKFTPSTPAEVGSDQALLRAGP